MLAPKRPDEIAEVAALLRWLLPTCIGVILLGAVLPWLAPLLASLWAPTP